jgi:signal transduction histidine kinase
MVAEQNINLIEARKIIEAQHQILLERNENLEEEIQKRTKELVDYNHQLEQFAFISSHNLRSPIARILGLGNLLELTVDTADESVIKKNLVHEARELDRVVKELSAILDVRKGTNKKVSEFNVKEGIELILSSLSLDISEAGAKIELSVQGNPMFRTVRPYFDSIVTNLVSNAIKYRNPKNTLLVQINWHYQGDFACLSIKDNGLGIDLNTYGQKVFSLYSRFHSHIDGKGLGLFMVKAQTESLGGKVEVNSLVDEGTTFCVYFKLS